MERKYDIIVFGASGVSGKYIVEELGLHSNKKFAVAGRDKEKLTRLLKKIAKRTDISMDDVEVIIADVTSESSLQSMCAQTKLLLNCVGPYRFYGEQVVKACLDNGTHYIDVCGEPQFLEYIQLKYYEEALKKGLYVVGACGFDSIPCDMGVEFLKKSYSLGGKSSGRANSVETYLEILAGKDTKANYATWQSAIHSFAHASELKPLRKQLLENLYPSGLPAFPHRLKSRPMLFKSEVTKKWCVYFMGSDKSVVTRSQLFGHEYKGEEPVQIQTYLCLPSFAYALLYLMLGALFVSLAKFEFGRHLLEEYPEFFSYGLFTKKKIKRKQLTSGSFKLTLFGRGWSDEVDEDKVPDKEMKITVRGPDPGYVTTAICAVAACSTLLDEKEKLPEGGGVLTPGAAFSKTGLIEKLIIRGVLMRVDDFFKP